MPFKAKPVLKDRIWGGQKLKQYNKKVENANIGESWETDKDSMPVLIKLIDANDILSVQVHPNDHYAWVLEHQKEGKTEAWVILDCDEDAEIVAGLKQGTTQLQLEQALNNGDIQESLNITKVKKGDCIYIPAGTVHSIGKGIVVYEVQQPSDITYRLYDWDRMDEMGIPRQLHIHKALKSINYSISEVNVNNLYELSIQPQQVVVVFQCEYFTTSYLHLKEKQTYSYQHNGFTALTVISGAALILCEDNEELVVKGDTWIMPELCPITLKALESIELIITEYPSCYKNIK
ncbi:MAG TPA: type I phosphomannose isomerase catalytic subunit [Patescibacteria group bacterium]|nr:type I phosphomannose isomerase catalytic subunit [Patescibacteria group bacterium]